MGEDVPLFRERFADRLRRRQLERPSTPGREWRASVGVVRRFHEALKEILLETVADGVGVDGIRGFQSWFFGGRWLCFRRSARGHEVNPSRTVPRLLPPKRPRSARPGRPLHAEGPRYGIRLSGAVVVGPEGRALLRAAAPRGASNRRESIASSWVRIVSGATVRKSRQS